MDPIESVRTADSSGKGGGSGRRAQKSPRGAGGGDRLHGLELLIPTLRLAVAPSGADIIKSNSDKGQSSHQESEAGVGHPWDIARGGRADKKRQTARKGAPCRGPTQAGHKSAVCTLRADERHYKGSYASDRSDQLQIQKI